MAALRIQIHPTNHKTSRHLKTHPPSISCSMQQPPQNNIKVVINGAAKEIGMAAVLAVTKARGMEVAGAVESHLVGEDIGIICGMEEALEIPIISDLTMVLGSIPQDSGGKIKQKSNIKPGKTEKGELCAYVITVEFVGSKEEGDFHVDVSDMYLFCQRSIGKGRVFGLGIGLIGCPEFRVIIKTVLYHAYGGDYRHLAIA